MSLDGLPPLPAQPPTTSAASFLESYLRALAASAYLFTLGWARARDRAKIREIGRKLGPGTHIVPELPVVAVTAMVPVNQPIDVREIDPVLGNVSAGELIILCRLVRFLQPTNLFEFGTFDGRTTINMAVNAPGATVYTLDVANPRLDSRFRDAEMEKQIVSLQGNSGNFDYSPYAAKMDFIFVDASHTFEYVINDSLEALRMLSPNGGTIVWHDYNAWDGVTSALNELRKRHDSFRDVVHIAGTHLAVARITN